MGNEIAGNGLRLGRWVKTFAASCALTLITAAAANAQDAGQSSGGEANLKLPDLSQVPFLSGDGHPGVDGHTLLLVRNSLLHIRAGFRADDLRAPEKSAGSPLDARNLRIDL